jgi:hypothetical protein
MHCLVRLLAALLGLIPVSGTGLVAPAAAQQPTLTPEQCAALLGTRPLHPEAEAALARLLEAMPQTAIRCAPAPSEGGDRQGPILLLRERHEVLGVGLY